MDSEGKKQIILFVGLKWHEGQKKRKGICVCGWQDEYIPLAHHIACERLDPTKPEDMEEIWEAFEEEEKQHFIAWLTVMKLGDIYKIGDILTNTLKSAEAIRGYIESKKGA